MFVINKIALSFRVRNLNDYFLIFSMKLIVVVHNLLQNFIGRKTLITVERFDAIVSLKYLLSYKDLWSVIPRIFINIRRLFSVSYVLKISPINQVFTYKHSSCLISKKTAKLLALVSQEHIKKFRAVIFLLNLMSIYSSISCIKYKCIDNNKKCSLSINI